MSGLAIVFKFSLPRFKTTRHCLCKCQVFVVLLAFQSFFNRITAIANDTACLGSLFACLGNSDIRPWPKTHFTSATQHDGSENPFANRFIPLYQPQTLPIGVFACG